MSDINEASPEEKPISQEVQDTFAEEPVEVPVTAAPDNPMRVLEALLFASDEILTLDKIKAIVPGMPDARKTRAMVDKINAQYSKERHPFEIVEIGGGYQFRTVSYYYPWVVQLFKEKTAKKLSIQSLECLAIIAYKQPLTKAEIEQIRGVLSDGAMKTLLEKRLVAICGRSDKAGRPLLYATTKEFLAYFGINKIADLPRIEEFESLAKEKLGELTETELQAADAEKQLGLTNTAPSENTCVPQGETPAESPSAETPAQQTDETASQPEASVDVPTDSDVVESPVPEVATEEPTSQSDTPPDQIPQNQ